MYQHREAAAYTSAVVRKNLQLDESQGGVKRKKERELAKNRWRGRGEFSLRRNFREGNISKKHRDKRKVRKSQFSGSSLQVAAVFMEISQVIRMGCNF